MASLGFITQYERFDDLQHVYTDSTGAPLNITGWSVEALCKSPTGVITEATGSIQDGPNGIATVPWQADWSATAGGWRLEIWVRNPAATRLHSSDPITWTVRTAIGQPFVA